MVMRVIELYFERVKCIRCNYPGRDSGCKVFRVKGTEGLILPGLDISGSPIIQDYVPKYVIMNIFGFDWSPQVRRFANNSSDFHLKVQLSRFSPDTT